ncbi:sulfatase-like hydrolase/transferase [Flavivirga rizhaonensis]|uniref:Arylsulfatase n=1 Tax=Flavivirga rizhaonensis TaxID=2559571 RepID=A0A4S1DST7_9FLAO|nr:sulfatase-like hydrolase/transferase [Flavivirga rizhaonensis]TGV00979.1 arylsulfatase [Flavivirga rizhaonensis]
MTIYNKLFLTLLVLSSIVSNGQNNKISKPNVLIIYTDDHRYTGVHSLGGMQVKTPNMDALANEGIVFENAYLMGAFSGATCIPSRAMLLSGRQLFSLRGQGHSIPEDHVTIGEAFQKAGYMSHIVGKWHQDNKSLVRSFNSGSTIMGRGVYLVDHFRMPLWDWDKKGNFSAEDAYLLVNGEKGKVERRQLTKDDKKGSTGTELNGPHTSEIFAENASNFIRNCKKNKPFFMYLAFHAPHDPRQAPQHYKDMYPSDSIQLPPSYMDQHPFDNGHMVLRDEALAPWPRTPEIAKKELADYYAIITHLDDQIGKVIATLKATGAYENTLIVFAGDSGLAVGNHGLMGKQNIYDEDGVHIPLVFSGGFMKTKGIRKNALSYTHDIFPTICNLVNIPIPESVNGKSLVPVINNSTEQVRDYTYHAYRQFQRAYRKGDYKLIEYVRAKDSKKQKGIELEFESGSRVTQLFNVEKDPWETQDLSFFPEFKEVVLQMRKEMKQKAVLLGDKKESINERYDFWDYY